MPVVEVGTTLEKIWDGSRDAYIVCATALNYAHHGTATGLELTPLAENTKAILPLNRPTYAKVAAGTANVVIHEF